MYYNNNNNIFQRLSLKILFCKKRIEHVKIVVKFLTVSLTVNKLYKIISVVTHCVITNIFITV